GRLDGTRARGDRPYAFQHRRQRHLHAGRGWLEPGAAASWRRARGGGVGARLARRSGALARGRLREPRRQAGARRRADWPRVAAGAGGVATASRHALSSTVMMRARVRVVVAGLAAWLPLTVDAHKDAQPF